MVCFCVKISFFSLLCVFISPFFFFFFFLGLFSHEKTYQVRHYLEGFDTLNMFQSFGCILAKAIHELGSKYHEMVHLVSNVRVNQ